MSDIRTRATRVGLEKHRLESEVYRVDFASGTEPRLAASETLTTGSIRVVRMRGNNVATDATTEFGATAPITGTVTTGAQASSAVQFTLGAGATGAQDADAEYYVRVSASTSARDMVSLHRLVVFELGDVAAP